MEQIQVKIENNVLTITLNNGKVNAITHQVISEINTALDQAEQESAVVILTGQAGMFSAGYDLNTMKASSDSAIALVTEGSKLARRMLAFPTPIIAACSGHAVAKGAFLLLFKESIFRSTNMFVRQVDLFGSLESCPSWSFPGGTHAQCWRTTLKLTS